MPATANIYIHVPFCRRKCPYCDFYSVDGAAASTPWRRRYVGALEKELALLTDTKEFHVARPPATAYIGGGTPSLLDAGSLAPLVRALGVSGVDEGALEFSAEVNPDSASEETLESFRALGVNRFSVGVQSFSDAALRRLGRVHDAEAARHALRRLSHMRSSRRLDLSMDLIFAIPGQTLGDWERELDEAIAVGPDHVSVYGLTYYEGTRLARARREGSVAAVDEETDAEMFVAAHERLTAAGYGHYEISNYARPGHECRHNLAVWRGEDYLGLGAAAHSRVGDRRWSNPPDVEGYCCALENGALPRRFLEAPAEGRSWRGERLMLALRLGEGADLSEWPERERRALIDEDGRVIEGLAREGLATFDGRRLALTVKGWLVYDAIVARFF